jgi:hypothetical protein
MALHDNDRRTVHDYMDGARSRYGAGMGANPTGTLISLAAIAFIIIFILAAGLRPAGDAARQISASAPTSASAPATK